MYWKLVKTLCVGGGVEMLLTNVAAMVRNVAAMLRNLAAMHYYTTRLRLQPRVVGAGGLGDPNFLCHIFC